MKNKQSKQESSNHLQTNKVSANHVAALERKKGQSLLEQSHTEQKWLGIGWGCLENCSEPGVASARESKETILLAAE